MNEKPKLDQLIPVPMMPIIATLRPHPIAAEFPMMSDAELESIKASIKERGIRPNNPIVLYGSPPMILDGRNRLKAAIAVGHKFTVKDFAMFAGSYEEAEAFSNDQNSNRRHLTAKQKEERIRAYIAQYPNLSSREIGRKLSVSHVTVEKYKSEVSVEEKEYRKFKTAWNNLSQENRDRFLVDCSE